MRSGVVEMCHPGVQDQLEMSLVKWNKEVEAFAAQRPAELLAERIPPAVGALTGVRKTLTPIAV